MIDAKSPPQPLVATCSRGLEEVLADELRALDLKGVAAGRGFVGFTGGLRAVYEANLCLRTAARVVVPVVRGQVKGKDDLYDLAATVPWHRYRATGTDHRRRCGREIARLPQHQLCRPGGQGCGGRHHPRPAGMASVGRSIEPRHASPPPPLGRVDHPEPRQHRRAAFPPRLSAAWRSGAARRDPRRGDPAARRVRRLPAAARSALRHRDLRRRGGVDRHPHPARSSSRVRFRELGHARPASSSRRSTRSGQPRAPGRARRPSSPATATSARSRPPSATSRRRG